MKVLIFVVRVREGKREESYGRGKERDKRGKYILKIEEVKE